MKRSYTFLILAAALAACTHEAIPEPIEEPTTDPKTFTLTVSASKGENSGDDEDTKALSLTGKTLSASWAEGEEVSVYNKTTNELLSGTLTAQEAGTSTTLKGSLTSTNGIHVGDKLTLKFLSPDYASQTGTLAYIAANCDYAEAEVEVTNASTPNVTTTEASFDNQQAIVKFNLKDIATGNPSINATKLTVTAGETTITVTPSGASSALFVAIPAISSQTVSLSANITPGYVYTYEKASATFVNSQYYEITVKMTKQYVDLGLLTDDFTAEDGDELRGTLAGDYRIIIDDDATVTLHDVTIDQKALYGYEGIKCDGDATIILEGNNTVIGGVVYSGIQPGYYGSELVIRGDGILHVSGGSSAPGIGIRHMEEEDEESCGDITITGGTIYATGGEFAAGIGTGSDGGGHSVSCGNITITGGTIYATGGDSAPGIGVGITTGGGGHRNVATSIFLVVQ